MRYPAATTLERKPARNHPLGAGNSPMTAMDIFNLVCLSVACSAAFGLALVLRYSAVSRSQSYSFALLALDLLCIGLLILCCCTSFCIYLELLAPCLLPAGDFDMARCRLKAGWWVARLF